MTVIEAVLAVEHVDVKARTATMMLSEEQLSVLVQLREVFKSEFDSEDVAQAFAKMDEDGSNELDYKEWIAAMSKIGVGADMAKRLFLIIDIDGSKSISLEEATTVIDSKEVLSASRMMYYNKMCADPQMMKKIRQLDRLEQMLKEHHGVQE